MTSRDPSLEPSSTTMTWRLSWVCASALAMHAPRNRPQSQLSMITSTLGCDAELTSATPLRAGARIERLHAPQRRGSREAGRVPAGRGAHPIALVGIQKQPPQRPAQGLGVARGNEHSRLVVDDYVAQSA